VLSFDATLNDDQKILSPNFRSCFKQGVKDYRQDCCCQVYCCFPLFVCLCSVSSYVSTILSFKNERLLNIQNYLEMSFATEPPLQENRCSKILLMSVKEELNPAKGERCPFLWLLLEVLTKSELFFNYFIFQIIYFYLGASRFWRSE
jgi:hypothetical protein